MHVRSELRECHAHFLIKNWSDALNDIRGIHKGAAAASPSVKENDVIDLSALLGVLWRGKLIVVLATLIAVFIGGYYAYV
ncbi:MAG: Wzz/FepE/Etk N-terminal domain-containing protein, partial [Paracoccaceae bacterium]